MCAPIRFNQVNAPNLELTASHLLALPFTNIVNAIEAPATNADSAYLEDVKILDTILNKISVLVNSFNSTSAIQALFSIHKGLVVGQDESSLSEFAANFIRQLSESFVSAQINVIKIRIHRSVDHSLWKTLELQAGNCQERTFLAGFLLEKDRLSYDVIMTENEKHCAILFYGKSAEWILDPWCLRYFKHTDENLDAFMAYDKKVVSIPSSGDLKDAIMCATYSEKLKHWMSSHCEIK